MRMKYILSLVTAVFVSGCVSDNSENVGTVKQEFHAWANYHWTRTSDQVYLDLAENLTPNWEPYLTVAASDWNTSSVLEATIVPGTNSVKRCKPVPGRIEICNSKYGRNGWLGIAQIWASGNHITQAVVKINDTYFSMAQYNNASLKQQVVCQEIGHTFGLDHQDESFNNTNLGTCMDYTSNPIGNEHPNLHDYEELETIYAHADGLAPSVILESSSEDLGSLIVDDGHQQKYVHKLGNNEWLITHVFLARQIRA